MQLDDIFDSLHHFNLSMIFFAIVYTLDWESPPSKEKYDAVVLNSFAIFIPKGQFILLGGGSVLLLANSK